MRPACGEDNGRYDLGSSTAVDRYRPPRQVSTAYPPHRIPLFSRSFSAFGLSWSVREIPCELRWYPAAPHNLGWGITMKHRQNLLISGRTKT
jgi:hypothetical protein